MRQHEDYLDRHEPVVVWLDRGAARHEMPIAAVWLTFDHQEDRLTFHSPTHSEEVGSLDAARIAAIQWSIETGIPLEGPLFEAPTDPPYMREAVERAMEREAARSQARSADRDRGYER